MDVVQAENLSEYVLYAWEQIGTVEALGVIIGRLEEAAARVWDLRVALGAAEPERDFSAWDVEYGDLLAQIEWYIENFTDPAEQSEVVQSLIYGSAERWPDSALPWILANELYSMTEARPASWQDEFRRQAEQHVRDNLDGYITGFTAIVAPGDVVIGMLAERAEALKPVVREIVKGELKARAVGTAAGVAIGVVVLGGGALLLWRLTR